jgi:hypothetical protein
MIRKPDADWGRESATVAFAQSAHGAASSGATLVGRGGHAVRGLVCWALAVLWGFAALAGGLGGSVPTLIGVGAMAAGMAWLGRRAFARARARGEETPAILPRD